MGSKQNQYAKAVLDSGPGGKDWNEATPGARIVSAALHSLATADESGLIAEAVDHLATEVGGMAVAITHLADEIARRPEREDQ